MLFIWQADVKKHIVILVESYMGLANLFGSVYIAIYQGFLYRVYHYF